MCFIFPRVIRIDWTVQIYEWYGKTLKESVYLGKIHYSEKNDFGTKEHTHNTTGSDKQVSVN